LATSGANQTTNYALGDVCEEKGRVLNVPVPQGDVEASAEADPLNHVGVVGTDKLYVRVVFDVPNPSTCPGGQGASAPRLVQSPPSGWDWEL
jgi:hypothetical protein